MHWPSWFRPEADPHALLGQIHGARGVRASARTGNLLILFDERVASPEDVLGALLAIARARATDRPDVGPLPDARGRSPSASTHGTEGAPGPAGSARAELPASPPERSEIVDSIGRLVGAALGLGLLALRRALHRPGAPPASTQAAALAASGAALEGFPALRHGARRLVGPGPADLLFAGAGVLFMTLSGSPVGLLVSAVVALREVTEIQACRAAWRRYEERAGRGPALEPGTVTRLAEGERVPLTARVVEGTGSVLGRGAVPVALAPGATVAAGSRLYGGPYVVELAPDGAPRPETLVPSEARSPVERYAWTVDAAALLVAAAVGLATRSPSRALAVLLLLSPRPALEGVEMADRSASARTTREGATIVARRQGRPIRRPDVLLLDGGRVLTDGLEVCEAVPLVDDVAEGEIAELALAVAAAADWPWGPLRPSPRGGRGSAPAIDGSVASAVVRGARYALGPPEALGAPVDAASPGTLLLALRREEGGRPVGLLRLQPHPVPGATDLLDSCLRHGVELRVVVAEDEAEKVLPLATRLGLELWTAPEPLAAVERARRDGRIVAVVSDSSDAAAAFARCDIAFGLSSGRRGRFLAPVDLLVPDLGAVAAAVETGVRHDLAARDAVALSVVENLLGAAWLARGAPPLGRASVFMGSATLVALLASWIRLRGREARRSTLGRLLDPRPERWGGRSIESVLSAFETDETGLTSRQAIERREVVAGRQRRNALLASVLDQVASPLTLVLAAGAGLSLVAGSVADVALIGAVIAANAAVGAAQEAQVDRAAAELERLTEARAHVLRDGRRTVVPAGEIVPGDILLLVSGEQVAADARIISTRGLEVDEAALTGESLPVSKSATGGNPESRVVLEGSDVTVGSGRAVVVAVGADTRMGATAAALRTLEREESPLAARLNRMLVQALPVAAAGGAVVALSGLAWRRPAFAQVALGASTAVAAVPEGLPLLAGIGQASVARRLAQRSALVRRLSAVEALGRVDVACVDKTGTLTDGRLAVHRVVGTSGPARALEELPDKLRHVLLTAALAGPPPTSSSADAHPTDVAVLKAAESAGLLDGFERERRAEAPFDPARQFHAVALSDRLCVKGSLEAVISRCDRLRRTDGPEALSRSRREALAARAEQLSAEGYRVLMVAEGAADEPSDDPDRLVALGFLCLRDSVRPGAVAAVERCRAAGVRMIMLTGDHPATARAVARELGIARDEDDVLTGDQIADLEEEKLDRQVEQASVIARISPLEKLRIVESLRRCGHTVAMTGDGVNDAPALRLADVGVAMGRSGTDVARQAAQVVLADDDVATLVEALVEGRTFWRNTRRSLGMLLGGNLGEVAFIASSSVLGLPASLTTRQILAVNLGSDVVPALSLAVEEPRGRELSSLAREGAAGLGAPLRRDILRRAASTALPTLATHLAALRLRGQAEAQSVAFAGVVGTQLVQTLEASLAEGHLSRPVLAGVAGSAALLAATLTLPPTRAFLGLARPAPLGWALIGLGNLGAVALARTLPGGGSA